MQKSRNLFFTRVIAGALLVVPAARAAESKQPIHVWQKHELTFTSARTFANPYVDATLWVDLSGPGFNKRVYGFWDGGRTFKVRVLATAPGTWQWKSGSSPEDPGLSGKSGSFAASDW